MRRKDEENFCRKTYMYLRTVYNITAKNIHFKIIFLKTDWNVGKAGIDYATP